MKGNNNEEGSGTGGGCYNGYNLCIYYIYLQKCIELVSYLFADISERERKRDGNVLRVVACAGMRGVRKAEKSGS